MIANMCYITLGKNYDSLCLSTGDVRACPYIEETLAKVTQPVTLYARVLEDFNGTMWLML